MHPSRALFQDQLTPAFLPVCDHYAGSEKLMRKSMELQQQLGPIFDITFDCEDGAATGSEASHANLVCELLNSDNNQFSRIGVRVHDIQHDAFEQDLSLIIPATAQRLAYIVLPKVNSAEQVDHAIRQINDYAFSSGRSNLPVHVLIETHDALADVMSIAALPQVECLSFGIMDFVSSHYGAIPSSAMQSPHQFEHPLVAKAKLEIAAACHRFGKVPSHNVTTDIRDFSVVSRDAHRAKNEFAYTRMWSIHPAQINHIVQVMAPQHDEITSAIEILTHAQQNNWAPIQHAGKLHDRASYRYFWTILKRAQSCALTLPTTATALLEGDLE